ncbi:MAG: 30S ribosomal protein S6 [Bacilli bacterium]
MKKYEIMFIVKATLSEEDIKKVVVTFKDILTKNGAKIVSFKETGQRELAYEIKKCKAGYYFVAVIETENDQAIKEFDRLALINKEILRHLITKIED